MRQKTISELINSNSPKANRKIQPLSIDTGKNKLLKKQETMAAFEDEDEDCVDVDCSEQMWSEVGSDPGSPVGKRETLKLFTGEEDEGLAPLKKKKDRLPWWYFNSDFYSSDRDYSEVKQICEQYEQKQIDLRPYMIVHPYVVQSTDTLAKCLELFRHMHIRCLPVISPHNGGLEGIITRQDIFAYMSL